MRERDTVEEQVRRIRGQLDALRGRAPAGGTPADQDADALEGLYAALEALRQGEELRAQSNELPMARSELAREHAAREAAESARAHLDAVIRHLPVGIMIAEAPSGRIVTYNPATEQIFAFPPPLAESVAEYGTLYTGFHPDGRRYAPEEWPMARAIRTGETVVGEEIAVVRPDGARRVLRVSAAPVRDGDGDVVAGVISMIDVTEERRRTETQRFLGEVSDVLSASLDHQATVRRIAEVCTRGLADQCVVHALEGGQVRGLGIAHAEPERTEELRQLLRRLPVDPESDHPVLRVLLHGEPQLFPHLPDEALERIAGDAEQLQLLRDAALGSLLVVPMRSGGRTLGAITLARRRGGAPFDQRDLELAEEVAARAAHAVDNARLFREAQHATRIRDETIRVVSHDLRNSLNAALTNADLLLDITPAFEPDSRPRRQMEALRRSLHHMHRLVQDLLEVDRIERGGLRLHLEPLLLGEITEDLAMQLEPQAREAGVSFSALLPPDLPPVRADGSRVAQVLANLVGNALQATAAGGRVELRAEAVGREVRVHVTDSGVGIHPDHLPRVFDRFFQAPARGEGGSGLGLTIARGIVEAHGGRMWAESQPGSGSTFSFALPVAEAPA